MDRSALAQIDSLHKEKLRKPLKIGGYIAGVFERAPVSPGQTNSFGLQTAVILKKHLQLGFYGMSYTNNSYREQLIFPNTFQMNYKHAGVLLGYRIHLDTKVAFNVESKLGLGEVKWIQLERGSPFLANKFQMIHLQASIDYLITNFLVINAFIGHRWMNGLDITGLNNDDFKGWYFGMALKVGKFK
ncbi:hypothetical protein [Reichenbachiella faecimaris]|nr:hypothetical protein [Reichenbachiella faecimaris]